MYPDTAQSHAVRGITCPGDANPSKFNTNVMKKVYLVTPYIKMLNFFAYLWLGRYYFITFHCVCYVGIVIKRVPC